MLIGKYIMSFLCETNISLKAGKILLDSYSQVNIIGDRILNESV